MNQQQIIGLALLNALPFLCLLALWCFKMLEHWLPGKQQAMLNTFVQQAVTMVEQLYGGAGPLEKKNLAIQTTIELFRAFRLPIPPLSALSTAIEATVYTLHQSELALSLPQQTVAPTGSQLTLAHLQEPDAAMAETTKMPAIRAQFRPASITQKGVTNNAAQ
jgi:hypothetical protein